MGGISIVKEYAWIYIRYNIFHNALIDYLSCP